MLGIIIQARNNSSRLPNKAIMKIKGNLRSIDIVIERAKQTGLPVILATSTDNSDRASQHFFFNQLNIVIYL